MPTSVKIIITFVAALFGIMVCLIDPKSNNAGADWFWRGGRRDPIRNLICRSDGTLRKYSKIGILFGIAWFLAIVWKLI